MMKTCPVCGEDIAVVSAVCPYCETPQAPGGRTTARGGATIATIDLEAGLPTVEEALARLKARIFDGVPKGGCAVVNADMPWSQFFVEKAKNKGLNVILYGERGDVKLDASGMHIAVNGKEYTVMGQLIK